jgi:hypothetical protein
MGTLVKLHDEVPLDEKLRMIRAERYALQSVAKKALPDQRVSKCLRLAHNQQVEVWRHLKTDKAFYNGLLVCGSVWNCPVCAAKISEIRKQELTQAFNLHKQDGGKIAMLTLTFSHQKTDRLLETLKKFILATSKFRSGKRYQNIREEMNMIGSIRAFEVTYGTNGFHPHVHIALFYYNNVSLDYIKYKLTEMWQNALNKFGLTGSEKYRLHLQKAENANDYVSKWSLEQELTKSHIKKGKKESLTPFDFLREYLNTEDNHYLVLFKDYAEALKGKRQLQWSKGLKERFLIVDKSDEQVAVEHKELADLLGTIPYDIWKYIIKAEGRAKFLDLTEKGDFEYALSYFKKKKESSSHEDSQT